MATTIECQFTGCDYIAEHASEAVAIAMLTSHNNIHQGSALRAATKQRVPKIDRPVLKQDINDEDWQAFEAEWRRFKRCTEMSPQDVADQLFQCCDKSLSRLLLKENPEVIETGEVALLRAMKSMAVIHVATTVRRANLLSLRQDHGQTFREFVAIVRAAAATCAYNVKCPHPCCAEKSFVDYTSLVVKDILISGLEDGEIRKDVLGMPELDAKTDKDILKFVEEKEIAMNALKTTMTAAAVSSYNKSRKVVDDNTESAATKKKLTMRGKCSVCSTVISLYKQYRSGKLNKEPFQVCISCYKKDNAKNRERPVKKDDISEVSSIISFIAALDSSENDLTLNMNTAVGEIASSENVLSNHSSHTLEGD